MNHCWILNKITRSKFPVFSKLIITRLTNMKEFTIIFDNPTKSYISGQRVSGRVIIVTDQDKKNIRGLKIVCSGKNKVRFKKGTGDNVKEYTAKQTLFEINHIPYRNDPENPTIFQKGTHSYPFEFTLPTGLPCTFKSKYGSTQYYITAILVKNSVFSGSEAKGFFLVKGLVDLNLLQEISIPIAFQESEMITTCCCWDSGLVTFAYKIPRGGFIPGELIPINVEIKNSSMGRINARINIKLVQIATFHAKSKKKTSKQYLATAVKGPMEVLNGSNDSEIWQNVLRIPPNVCASTFGQGRIIDIQYYIDIEVYGEDFSHDARISIKMGTIPLRMQPANNDPGLNEPPPEPYFHPPSYNDAMAMNEVKLNENIH